MTTKKPNQKVAKKPATVSVLVTLLRDTIRFKAEAKSLTDAASTAHDNAVETMRNLDLPTIDFDDAQLTYHCTLVQPEVQLVDWDMIADAIGAKEYRNLCVATPQKDLLDAAVKAGKVSVELVASATTFRQNKAHIRITPKAKD